MSNAKKFIGVSVGEFCRVLDSEMCHLGVKKGDVVYVAGNSMIPYPLDDDPYLHREVFVAARVDKGHVLIDEGGFTIDGKRLKSLPDKRQARLQAIFAKDFHKEAVCDDDIQEVRPEDCQ